MRIFTLDVGSGTQDFMLSGSLNCTDCKVVRNSVKMILPSPTRIVASKIERSKDVFLHGYTMGGGPCKKAAFEHAKNYRVVATERAALSFSDDLEKVREVGIEVVGESKNLPNEFTAIEMKDVDWEFFTYCLDRLGIDYPDLAIVAVQDHGYSVKKSNRRFRFEFFEKMLRKGAKLSDFVYNSREVPEVYNRMRSVVESYYDSGKPFGELYVVDTVFAAMAGCAAEAREFPALVMNFGNSHFVGAVVEENGRILSMFEHHTRIVEERGKEWISNFINRFIRGEVDFEDVYEDGGHGAYVGEVVEVRDAVSTGPRVELSPCRVASSCGEVMITGNVGMLSLLEQVLENQEDDKRT